MAGIRSNGARDALSDQDGVRVGVLHGGLRYRALGRGPTLVVFPGFSAENADPTGRTRRMQLRPFQSLAPQFSVYLVNRRTLAQLTVAGKPRRAWAATGHALAATVPTGYVLGALMWLSGTVMNPADPSDMLVTIDAEDVFDASADLHRITAPTLVIAGDRDRNYTPGLFRETVRRIPGARLCRYPGKGHLGTVTHRRVADEIRRFLAADDA